MKVVPLASLVVTFPPHFPSLHCGRLLCGLFEHYHVLPLPPNSPLGSFLSLLTRLPRSTILSGGPGRMMRPSTFLDGFRFTSGMTLKQSFRF
uniref:Uncharacterized protein n=1 Tax=Utricularia reniformis TaxID=192314 RepID=A0A1Y0B1H1_9LAMI|nr:hypothetical protein AEK19_MT0976 [Utricularia reniformis]ART31199.1 hypothetical protein AEK19_MT0976 [Utricularia reniformis]